MTIDLRISYPTGAEPETLLDLLQGDRCYRDGRLTRDPTGLPVVVDAKTGATLGAAACGEVYVYTEVDVDDFRGQCVYRELSAEERDLIAAARLAGYRVRVDIDGDERPIIRRATKAVTDEPIRTAEAMP